MSNFGTFDFLYLPYARRRQFSSREGRLRFPIVIERQDIDIDSGSEEWRPSAAFKWSHYFGALDVATSYFHGVSREPLFLNLESDSPTFFLSHYQSSWNRTSGYHRTSTIGKQRASIEMPINKSLRHL